MWCQRCDSGSILTPGASFVEQGHKEVAMLRNGVAVAGNEGSNSYADGAEDSAKVLEVRAAYFRKRRLLVRRPSHCSSGLRTASYCEPRRTSTPLPALL